MMLKRVANKISGDKVLISCATIIGLSILKNDIDQNIKLNDTLNYKNPDIIVKSGIFDKKIKSIDYSSFRFPFQRTIAFPTNGKQMIHNVNFGNCNKRIYYCVKISDIYDVQYLFKRLDIYSFDDMHKLKKLDGCIKEIVQTQIDKLECNYDLYKNDTKLKNELILNINRALSLYGHFITDIVIGI